MQLLLVGTPDPANPPSFDVPILDPLEQAAGIVWRDFGDDVCEISGFTCALFAGHRRAAEREAKTLLEAAAVRPTDRHDHVPGNRESRKNRVTRSWCLWATRMPSPRR